MNNSEEERRAREEAPHFAVTLARVRAKARGEVYDPSRHGPFEPAPYVQRRKRVEQATPPNGNLSESITRIMAKYKRAPVEDWTTQRRDLA